jgi:branched-chain amino acid transport system ATP-binding protein
MSGPILKLDDVRKSFGDLEIIRGANLEVQEGERHALIGPNGAGKSTVFNLISGLFRPSAGQILLREQRIDGRKPEDINKMGLSRSFQITSIFERLSVFENLRIGLMPRFGVRGSILKPLDAFRRIGEETEKLLETVRLTSKRDVPAGELPYSDQRALEIGLTLATNPDVILLDEPTSGMSREEAEYAVDLIRVLTEGRTLLVVEHDMDVVFKLCDRISVLVYGEVIGSGTPDVIRNDPDVQRAYLDHKEA